MSIKLSTMIDRIADLVVDAIDVLKASFEKRFSAIDQTFGELKQELAAARATLTKAEEKHLSTVQIQVETKEFQKTLDDFREQILREIEAAQKLGVSQLNGLIMSFQEAAMARDKFQNELTGQLQVLLSERSAQPSLDAMVRQVVQELRATDDALLSRSKEAAEAIVAQLKGELSAQVAALETAFAEMPSVATLGKEVRGSIEIPDVSQFATIAQAREFAVSATQELRTALIAEEQGKPSEEEVHQRLIERAVTVTLEKIPTVPDVSKFLVVEQAAEMIAAATKGLQPAIDVSDVALDVSKLLDVSEERVIAKAVDAVLEKIPAAPDVSGFINEERVTALLANATKGLQPVLDLTVVAREIHEQFIVDGVIEGITSKVLSRVPPAPDVSKFLTSDQVQEIVLGATSKMQPAIDMAALTESLAETLSVNEAEVVKRATAAALSMVPAAPDVSQFIKTSEVEAMLKAEREDIESLRIDPADVAKKAAELMPVTPTLDAIVQAALPFIPVPKDGESVTIEQVAELVTKAVAQLELPTTESIVESLGSTHVANWALDFERRAQDLLQRIVERIPAPKDGVDGMGFDDMTVEFDGQRTFIFSMVRGERKKTFSVKTAMMIYRNIFDETIIYDQGDVVTWAGSSWIALKDAPKGKPGDTRDWQLVVKKGRDGRDKQ